MHCGDARVAKQEAEAGANAPARGHHPLSRGTLDPAFKTTTLSSARTQHYEEQITRVPIEHSYIVNGVEFDGYDGFALIDAKGPGYANPIKGHWSNEPKSTYKTDPVTGEVKRVKKGLLQIGKDQVKAVRATGTDTPIQWHIAEKYTFDVLREKQDWGEFPAEIELFYTPPN